MLRRVALKVSPRGYRRREAKRRKGSKRDVGETLEITRTCVICRKDFARKESRGNFIEVAQER